MSSSNRIYGITAGNVVTLAPLVAYSGGTCFHQEAVKILEGLAAIEPSPPTVTWLQATMAHPNAFYGRWWTGEMSDTQRRASGQGIVTREADVDTTREETARDDGRSPLSHWVSVYPRYMEMYVILGGRARTPVVKGGQPLGSLHPEMLRCGIQWGGAETQDLLRWNVEGTVLLRPVDLVCHVPRKEIRTTMVKYLRVKELELEPNVIEMVTSSLRGLESHHLTARQVRYATRDVVEYFLPRVVDHYLCGREVVHCRNFFDVLGHKMVVDAIDKYDYRAMLLLCPPAMLQHLLGWPVRCELEGHGGEYQQRSEERDGLDIPERLEMELLKVLDDLEAFELRTIERNLEDAHAMAKRLGSWAKVAEMDDDTLGYAPGDLVWGIQSRDEIYAVVRGEECDDGEMNYESQKMQERAVRDGLPVQPLPVLQLVDHLCDVDFHRRRLKSRKKEVE